MKEYIERAVAIDAIRKYQYPYGVEFLLSNIPATDVMEVRHGYWRYSDGLCYCSECGEIPQCFEPDYCPNCGARMDKEDEHEAN